MQNESSLCANLSRDFILATDTQDLKFAKELAVKDIFRQRLGHGVISHNSNRVISEEPSASTETLTDGLLDSTQQCAAHFVSTALAKVAVV